MSLTLTRMEKVFALLTLGRPLTSLLIALAIVSATLVGAGYLVLQQSFLIFLASLIGFSFGIGGNALNDYFDLEVDKINHPQRPLPSGKIGQSAALHFSFFMFVLTIVLTGMLTLFVGFGVLFVVLLAIAFQIVYEKKLKQVKFFGNILIGILSSFAFLFGGIVVDNIFATGILAICAFLSIMSREIVKDIEDLKGDFGKKTLPKVIGTRNAGLVSSILLIAAICISIYAFFPLSYFRIYYMLIVMAADVIFVASIPMIFTKPYWARRVMKVGMIVVLLAFIIGGMSR